MDAGHPLFVYYFQQLKYHRMHIGFDAKRAILNSSGLGNYARTLIKSLNAYHPENHYTLFTPRTSQNAFQKVVSNLSTITVQEPESFIDKKLRARWRSYGITPMLNEKNINVYHGLSNELPFNIHQFKGKKVVTIHDLIFLRYPHLYPFIDRKIYNKKFRNACDTADVIIAISNETKRDIENYFFVPESKIRVVYQSCDELYYRDLSDHIKGKVLTKYNLPSEYLLYVGTIEERKNLLTLVKALKQTKEIPLVVVGNKKSYFNKVMHYITENKLQNRVHFLENTSNDELPAIYSRAKIFIFPSFFEGFGIPIIEALTSKIPVITTAGGCFPEAGGPGSIYIDPNNEKELADRINFLLGSEMARTQMAEKGFEYAQKQFHPKKCVDQLIRIYQE
jgi:glycosyltransferase involved in cell wall biosynthesis